MSTAAVAARILGFWKSAVCSHVSTSWDSGRTTGKPCAQHLEIRRRGACDLGERLAGVLQAISCVDLVGLSDREATPGLVNFGQPRETGAELLLGFFELSTDGFPLGRRERNVVASGEGR
jgi:hypothetical protein